MTRTLIAAFALAVACAPAYGQRVAPYRLAIRTDTTAQPTRDLGTVVKRSPALEDMKAALRDLIVAQKRYFAAHDTYAADGRALDIGPAKHGQAQVHVTFAGRGGWAGTATEPSLRGKNCVIYVGSVKALPNGAPKTDGGIEAKREGVPACDEP